LISTPLSPNATVNATGRMAPAQQKSGGGDSGKMVLERRPSGRCVGGGAALALLCAIELAWLREREEEIIAHLKAQEA